MPKKIEVLGTEDKAAIRSALRDAEANTCGEIVPVVAVASGRYDRAEDMVGVAVGLVALTIAWIYFQDVTSIHDQWSGGTQLTLELGAILTIVLIGFILGSRLAAALPALRLPFISKNEMAVEVERRSAECFHRFGIGNTTDATGVLIYISLYEHIVRVEGDANINAKLNDQQWQSVCDLILEGIKAGNLSQGLSAGIARAGELLSGHFPCQQDARDQLANEVHVIGEL